MSMDLLQCTHLLWAHGNVDDEVDDADPCGGDDVDDDINEDPDVGSGCMYRGCCGFALISVLVDKAFLASGDVTASDHRSDSGYE